MRVNRALYVTIAYTDRSGNEGHICGVFATRSDATRVADSDARKMTDPFEWKSSQYPRIGDIVRVVDHTLVRDKASWAHRFLNRLTQFDEVTAMRFEIESLKAHNSHLLKQLETSTGIKLLREELEAQVRNSNEVLLPLFRQRSMDGCQIRALAVSSTVPEARSRLIKDFVTTSNPEALGCIAAASTDTLVAELNREIQPRVHRDRWKDRAVSMLPYRDDVLLTWDRVVFTETRDGIRAGDTAFVVGVDRNTNSIAVSIDRNLTNTFTTISLSERTDVRLGYAVTFDLLPKVTSRVLMLFAPAGHGASALLDQARANRIYVYADELAAKNEFSSLCRENQVPYESPNYDPLFPHIRER